VTTRLWCLPRAASRRKRLRRLLVVSHTEMGDTTRIISARTTTRHERKFYEESESHPI
jgi:uncharacterized DUF497 family protein